MTYTIRQLNDNGESLISGTLLSFSNEKKAVETSGEHVSSVILVDPGLNMSILNGSNKPDEILYGHKLYEALVEQWKSILDTVSTILLTQSTIDRLGSYSFLFNHFQELIYEKDLKVYSTLPVINLGRLSTVELYCSKNLMGNFTDHRYEVEDIEQSFDYITPLKYSQPIKLLSSNVQFIAYSSGHSLGSSIIKFTNLGVENEFVLYFSEWSHVGDSIADGTSILDRMNFWNPHNEVMHPSSIISNVDKVYTREDSLQPWVKRSNKFKSYLFSNLNNKNLLIMPVDISSNFLKIFTLVAEFYQEYNRSDFEEDKLLDQFETFSSNANNKYGSNNNPKHKNKKQRKAQLPPIYLLSNSKGRSITYCKSMLEWLKESLLKNWNSRFNKNGNSSGNNTVKTPFDQEIQVLTPEDFDSEDRRSSLNKKKIIETGGILFVNDDVFLLNKIIQSFNSKDKNLSAAKAHLIFTDIKQKYKYQKYLSDKELDIILKTTEPVDDDEVLKSINSRIIQNSKRRKDLVAAYDEKKKLANEEAASLVYDARDDELSDSDDENFADKEEEQEAADGDVSKKEAEAEKDSENSPYDVVIKETTSQKNKMFKIKTSTYMRDEYGLIIDFDELFAEGEDDLNTAQHNLKTVNGNSVAEKPEDEKSNKDANKDMASTAGNGKFAAANDDEEDDDMYDDFMTLSRNSVYDQNGSYFDDLSYLNVLNKKIFYKSSFIQEKISLKIPSNFIDLTSIIDLKSSQIILPFFKAQNYVYYDESTTKLGGLPEKIRVMSTSQEQNFHTIMKNLDCILSANLEENLHWESVLNGKYQISKVSCDLVKVVNKTDGSVKYKIQPATDSSKSNEVSSVSIASAPTDNEENADLQLGNVTLSKIRNLLLNQNHDAVFLGNGSLLVDNSIFIGKVNNSVVQVKGKPSPLYYKVRKIVNGMLASI